MSATPKILLVGDTPSSAEHRFHKGAPLSYGRPGEELNKLLLGAGIDPSKVDRTYVVPTPVDREPKKFFFQAKNYPSPVYLHGIANLVKLIQETKPNVVVPLGNHALWALTTFNSVHTYRGSILWSPIAQVKVVPTLHPNALLRGGSGDDAGSGMWKLRPVVIWDLQRIKHESTFPERKLRPRQIIIDPIGADLDEAVGRLRAAEALGFDIESYGGKRLACIGFSDNDPEWSVVLSYDGSNYRRELFKSILEGDNPKYGQNLMYDTTMLDQNGIHAKNIVHDTMIAQHKLMPEHPKGLDFLTSVYTDIPYYKDEGKVWSEDPNEENRRIFFTYNGKDVCATTEVYQAQLKELKDEGLEKPFQRAMRVFEPLRWATYYGSRCNTKLLSELIQRHTTARDSALRSLKQQAWPDFNPNSPQQVAKLVYEIRGLPARTKQGKLKTDAKTLKDLEARTGDPILIEIVGYRKHQKLLSNYYNDKILSPDGRLRSSYNIAGTASGRLSSAEPLWGPGLNGQNIPPAAREMYEADDGFEIWEFDQSQAEAVILAYVADDPIHMDCFRTGKDVHRVTACLLTGMDPDKWAAIPKEAPIRQIAKKANHSFNYNVGINTFMQGVNAEYDRDDPNSVKLDFVTAKAIHAAYLRTRPALEGYWEKIRVKLRQDRTLVNPLGNRYIFLDHWSDEMLRLAYSWIPQSTVGESTNEGINQVYASEDDDIRYLFKNGMRLWGQVHDSAAFLVPVGARQYAMKVMKHLEVPLLINGYQVVVPIEGGAGKTWNKKTMEDLGKSRKSCEVGYD